MSAQRDHFKGDTDSRAPATALATAIASRAPLRSGHQQRVNHAITQLEYGADSTEDRVSP
ncbi:hypothetical protein GCM10010412_069420 [Nonomuraea recticatena]|uniref:Uncharacterized protein n=1 Tax=Nonomuraea recticatena TaxID=46178 RepID=A0ABN3ST13_9ACTN